MRVCVVLHHRFLRTADGKIWSKIAFDYGFWQRYLLAFDSVRIVARVEDSSQDPADLMRVDGDRVELHAVPYYKGPEQLLRKAKAVGRAVLQAAGPDDAVILRVPTELAFFLAPRLWRTGRPYAVEVVGDAFEVFSAGSVKHPLRALFRWWTTLQQKRQCAGACAAAYVSRLAFEERYACPGYCTSFSSVFLPPEAFVAQPRHYIGFGLPAEKQWKLLLVGSLEQMYKGADLLIEAIAICAGRGLNVALRIVGEGKYRKALEEQVERLALSERVCFVGQVSAGAGVRAELDAADLFVLPSRTEGLPRVLLEAMARGLPCIASAVGGIPEILDAENMVAAGKAEVLAEKISEVLGDAQRLNEMSMRNMEIAGGYRNEVLLERRRDFYSFLKEATLAYLRKR